MTLSGTITWFLWMEYSSLSRLVEKMLLLLQPLKPSLSVIEWVDNGADVDAHKATGTSITPPLSPLHKCVFMHGNTCTSSHVHGRRMCLGGCRRLMW